MLNLLSLLNNRMVMGGLVVVVIVFFAWRWYSAQLEAAYNRGYDQRQTEIQAAHAAEVTRLTAENNRLRNADTVRVETVIEERVRTETVIEYIDREIPVLVESDCRQLSDDWVQLYNAAAGANHRHPEHSTDSPQPQAALPAHAGTPVGAD